MRRGIRGRLALAGASIAPWPFAEPPSEERLELTLPGEGLEPHWWSNGPGDRYGSHEHPYFKALYCLSGSIRFTTPAGELEFGPGARLEIPPGTPYAAIVGPSGVRCVEAARP